MERSAVIEAALRAARAGDWTAYRARFAELRAGCAALTETDEELRQRFDMLAAAAPQHDPEGCIAALEDLAALLRAAPGGWAPAPPALDLRGLAPPEPIVRIFQALERAPGEPLRAILPHEPVPLYALLAERGFTYRGAQRADGGYELLIEPVSLR